MGNTANLALPYPENTDPLANMAAAIQALANAIDSLEGGAWTAYTPVLTGITIGNGTVVARRRVVGKTVHVRVAIVGGTTSSGSTVAIGLPYQAHASGDQMMPWRSSASGSNYAGWAYIPGNATSGAGYVYTGSAGGVLTQAGFGNGFTLVMEGTYERA